MTQEALKLALDALEDLNNTNSYWWQEVDQDTIDKIDPAITAIKEALAHSEQLREENERQRIVNLLMMQHEAAKGAHNYWHVAAQLIQADVASDT